MGRMRQAINRIHTGAYDNFSETVAVLSLRDAPISITLANPELPDCPLIGVSDGFRDLTGFLRAECLGQNCRFLNQGCPMKAETRHKLRIAVRTGQTFVDILTNTRKDGKRFKNLLHMSTLRIGSGLYLVGIQANASESDLDLCKEAHRAELAMLVDRIFQSSVDVWVAMQSANFSTNIRISEVPAYFHDTLEPIYEKEFVSVMNSARDEFVSLEKKLYQSNTRLGTKNTFLEGFDECDPCEAISLLRKVSSEPLLCSTTSLLDSDAEEETNLVPLPLNCFAEPEVASSKSGSTPQEELKSIGSAHHPNGCTPCSFFCYSMAGCNKAQNCEYCHEDHPKKKSRRGKKKRRGDAAQFAELEISDMMSSYPQRGDDDSGSQDSSRGGSQHPGRHEDSSRGGSQHPDAKSPEIIEVTKQLPAATPEALVQLLSGLAWLAPLPGIAPGSTNTTSKPPSFSAFQGQLSSCGGSAGNVIMWYNEPTVVLEVGQWKQLIPFVTAIAEGSPQKFEPCKLSWSFEVEPELPRDFILDPRRGVIKGFAHVTQPDTTYIVVARAASLSITMALSICVIAPPVI
jgi:hypothetical protein